MPSGLQDLLSIIDKGYEAEQRREDRDVRSRKLGVKKQRKTGTLDFVTGLSGGHHMTE